MLAKFVYLLAASTFTINNVASVQCNFTFVESEPDNNLLLKQGAQTHIVLSNDSSREVFNCEQNLDDGFELFTHNNDSGKAETIGNRFNSHESYELQEQSCVSNKRFIIPRALNNIYNHLTPVLNTATFLQKIQITECRTLKEACNDGIFPSSNFKYICWQEYLVIKLLAYNNEGALYNENFYYPSHCSCRLVKVTRRSKRKPQIVYVK